MATIINVLFGSSWKSSIAGLAVGICLAVVAYAQTKQEPGWYVVALGFAALGRLAKDWNVSNAPAPAPAAPVPPAA